MGNCSDKDLGSKPSKQKQQDNTPKSKLVVMTFAPFSPAEICSMDHQPPTFSDSQYFKDSKADISSDLS